MWQVTKRWLNVQSDMTFDAIIYLQQFDSEETNEKRLIIREQNERRLNLIRLVVWFVFARVACVCVDDCKRSIKFDWLRRPFNFRISVVVFLCLNFFFTLIKMNFPSHFEDVDRERSLEQSIFLEVLQIFILTKMDSLFVPAPTFIVLFENYCEPTITYRPFVSI